MGPHPGWPPVIASPGGLVTLLRWEGAKIDPGVGLECWGGGKRDQRWGPGKGEGCSVLVAALPAPPLLLRGPQAATGGWPRLARGRGSWEQAGSGQSLGSRWLPGTEGAAYLFRGRVAALGHLGGVLSPEGLWWAPTA